MLVVRPEAPSKVIAGRYELGGQIGRGGMGEVWEGVDLRLGRAVAVKLLRADIAADPELRRRFEVEARAAAALSHPNVVAVYDTGEHEGIPYIVMERLPGRSLADEIADGRLDPERARQVAREVLAALEAAHGAGVVHRDIKPSNILLTSSSSVKVGDFGIAKVAEGLGHDLTVTGDVLGTPAYLPPERLNGRPATDQSDLFSLGVVLYEALSGTRPFEGTSPWEVARAVGSAEHRSLDEVVPRLPEGLVRTVERAMAKDPGDRFASAAEMARSLEPTTAHLSPPPQATERLPTSAVKPAPRTGVRWPPARRVQVAVAAVVVIVLVLVLVGTMGGDGSSPDPRPPAPTADSTPLPQPLDRALDDLEESVRP